MGPSKPQRRKLSQYVERYSMTNLHKTVLWHDCCKYKHIQI